MISIRASADKVGEMLNFVDRGNSETVGVTGNNVPTLGVQAESSQKNKRNIAYFQFFI